MSYKMSNKKTNKYKSLESLGNYYLKVYPNLVEFKQKQTQNCSLPMSKKKNIEFYYDFNALSEMNSHDVMMNNDYVLEMENDFYETEKLNYCRHLPISHVRITEEVKFVGNKRGKIKGFSKNSRKRLMKLLNKTDIKFNYFLTLTFSDDYFEKFNNYNDLIADVKKKIDVLMKRINRKEICAIWRIEFQTRKSGRFKGLIFPHLHFLLEVKNDNDIKYLQQSWVDICAVYGAHQKVTLHEKSVSLITNRGQLLSYVSKYISKVEENICEKLNIESIGRQWGYNKFVKERIKCFEIPITYKVMYKIRRIIAKKVARFSKKYAKRIKKMTQFFVFLKKKMIMRIIKHFELQMLLRLSRWGICDWESYKDFSDNIFLTDVERREFELFEGNMQYLL